MKRAIIMSAVGLAAGAWLMACSCNRREAGVGDGRAAGAPPQVAAPGRGGEAGEKEAPVQGTYTGVLHGGMVAIGGETTGWMLQGPGDGKGGGMDVDVSGVRESAQRLAGQRVVIRGKVQEKRYVERGVVKVLVAEEIAAAE